MKFEDFAVGQTFAASITITKADFGNYISFARTRNILHENPQLAEKETIRRTMLPGRSLIARAEGEMTRLPIFSDCIMVLYGMDGDPAWSNRNTRFLGEAYAGEELEVNYTVSEKKEDKGYGILAIDFVISRVRDKKMVVVSRKNLFRIKKVP
jgi:acyl dehydratase